MRIIGGSAKGRRLKAPKGKHLRPTAARVKEALFDILPHDLTGLQVLDLFAGTGNMGIEALSRGAASATLVELSNDATRVIRDNASRVGVARRCRVLGMPVDRALRRLERDNQSFDLIFIDPPYGRKLAERTLRILGASSLLRDGGAIIAEHSARDAIDDRYGALILRDRRRYGDTLLSFFAWQRGPQPPDEGNATHGT
jgi:16S rRNA (guanine(966)-N(2))-methyltransferase RsmD